MQNFKENYVLFDVITASFETNNQEEILITFWRKKFNHHHHHHQVEVEGLSPVNEMDRAVVLTSCIETHAGIL
jgi:hypothetical protein